MAEEIEKCPRCGSTELKEVDNFSASVLGNPITIFVPSNIDKLKICTKCRAKIYPKKLEEWLKNKYGE